MHATLLDVSQITHATAHQAFTSIAHWHGAYYLAYREAQHHGIVPPGDIRVLKTTTPHRAHTWGLNALFARDQTDYRDPRFVTTSDLLYLVCGAYLPSPHLQHAHGLSAVSGDNQIWSYYTYTRDGVTWAPLTPYLRPNHWGWSATRGTREWYMASYDVGVFELCNTITLWGGTPRTGMRHLGIMYDGGGLEKDQGVWRAPYSMPSEPVLYQPTPDTFACCLRTEGAMLHGVWRRWQAWRWQDTGLVLHPSAMLDTPHGWLLAARALTPVRRKPKAPVTTSYDTSVALYHVEGNRFTPLLTLPGSEDCGYASICMAEKTEEYFVSWYASDKAPSPCSDVFVGKVHIDA